MIEKEPLLLVGIVQKSSTISGRLEGGFLLPDGTTVQGPFQVGIMDDALSIFFKESNRTIKSDKIVLSASGGASFSIHDVTIGIQFHWERKEAQKFHGDCIFLKDTSQTIAVINRVPLEEYLKSVIASEMSANAPLELLKAHAVTSRSWLAAMLARIGKEHPKTSIENLTEQGVEITRWYGREEHALFDVCADDHCQRYHGITRIISDSVQRAIEETRGSFLVYDNQVCDARYSKSCGGRTELFKNAWEDTDIPYLSSIPDREESGTDKPINTNTEEWFQTRPHAFCNTADPAVLKMILPGFDQETADFFRWRVSYKANELASLLLKKSGIDFGTILSLEPIERGPSGRIVRLRIEGAKKTVVVSKELEIRRWLAPTHLYSSAFTVEIKKNTAGVIEEFILHGAGWGHGVGLCQIGAAVMALSGKSAETILRHYFRGVQIRKVY